MNPPKVLTEALGRTDAKKKFWYAYEDEANTAQRAFEQAFPVSVLAALKIDDYVIGHGIESFCWHLEVGTRAWASVYGATSSKFGVYYGVVKDDPRKMYRSAKKFDVDPKKAFVKVRQALLELVAAGKRDDFEAIDGNPLSQMFKAKILSLYFPKKYINVCDKNHLRDFVSVFAMGNIKFVSEIQHRLMDVKRSHPTTREWSNPKFMAFIYDNIRRYPKEGKDAKETGGSAEVKTKPKIPPKVDFDAINAGRKAAGLKAEAFALAYEKKRLRALKRMDLCKRIENRSKQPGYGYDIRSFESDGRERHIEVKSVAKVNKSSEIRRFFLTRTEIEVSERLADSYYFYFVSFNDSSEPFEMKTIPASYLYPKAEKSAEVFVMRFDYDHFWPTL